MPEVLRVARVINCSGPGADYDRIAHPLVRSLLAEGTARPDPLRLGLDVTANCALLGRTGTISRRVFAVGPVTKAAFWEMTAVPDIRRQCEVLAQHLASVVKAMPAPPRAAARRSSLPLEASAVRPGGCPPETGTFSRERAAFPGYARPPPRPSFAKQS